MKWKLGDTICVRLPKFIRIAPFTFRKVVNEYPVTLTTPEMVEIANTNPEKLLEWAFR